MIYLSDDYVTKYQDVLGYLIGRAVDEGYSPRHIEKMIAYSSTFSSLEKSDITEIAFSSKEALFDKIFETKNKPVFSYNPYDIYGWIGYIYIRLFFDLKITFEFLFIALPIDDAINMYHLYHEMDYQQLLQAVKSRIVKTNLNTILENRAISSAKLASLSNVPLSTVVALRYGHRDINKTEAYSLLRIANVLKIKIESLFPDINLVFFK